MLFLLVFVFELYSFSKASPEWRNKKAALSLSPTKLILLVQGSGCRPSRYKPISLTVKEVGLGSALVNDWLQRMQNGLICLVQFSLFLLTCHYEIKRQNAPSRLVFIDSEALKRAHKIILLWILSSITYTGSMLGRDIWTGGLDTSKQCEPIL